VAVEAIERDAAKLEFPAAIVARNTNVHNHGARLLNLSDTAKFHVVGEPSAQVVAGRVRVEITRGNTGQDKEDKAAHGED
jgi:hypothetical protein